MVDIISKELEHENFHIEAEKKDQKTVAASFIKFSGLLYELGLSPLRTQKIFIKIELDKNPPDGFKSELTVINKEYLIAINHYDLPSLFSGKLHAILFRKYAKGRDYYDLLWYLGRHIEPNYALLENAIFQTEQKRLTLNKSAVYHLLKQKISKVDFRIIQGDISPFLADNRELRFFNKYFFLQMLEKDTRL